MRLTVVMIGVVVAGFAATAHPAVAAEDVCVQVGWTDPVTGSHPRSGPCEQVTGSVPLCADPNEEPFFGVGGEAYVCVPSPGRN
jgi:hypothetical protein